MIWLLEKNANNTAKVSNEIHKLFYFLSQQPFHQIERLIFKYCNIAFLLIIVLLSFTLRTYLCIKSARKNGAHLNLCYFYIFSQEMLIYIYFDQLNWLFENQKVFQGQPISVFRMKNSKKLSHWMYKKNSITN